MTDEPEPGPFSESLTAMCQAMSTIADTAHELALAINGDHEGDKTTTEQFKDRVRGLDALSDLVARMYYGPQGGALERYAFDHVDSTYDQSYTSYDGGKLADKRETGFSRSEVTPPIEATHGRRSAL